MNETGDSKSTFLEEVPCSTRMAIVTELSFLKLSTIGASEKIPVSYARHLIESPGLQYACKCHIPSLFDVEFERLRSLKAESRGPRRSTIHRVHRRPLTQDSHDGCLSSLAHIVIIQETQLVWHVFDINRTRRAASRIINRYLWLMDISTEPSSRGQPRSRESTTLLQLVQAKAAWARPPLP